MIEPNDVDISPDDTELHKRMREFGERIRALRQQRGWTVRDLATRAGLAASTISKVENARMSPTYDNMLRLAHGLNVHIEALFNDSASLIGVGRRSVVRKGEGIHIRSKHYRYEILSSDIAQKKFFPVIAKIDPNIDGDRLKSSRHPGEEFVYVMSGSVNLATEHYSPTVLNTGDSCYFDSTMEHSLTSTTDTQAVVLWISSFPATGDDDSDVIVAPE
ncbi:helix-turn-helix domain-containing protein [Ochrobactrum chromiisoli]|uniref:XRE family transcriptional regulator n=1 Tax=Ochrobactrum chromiisoli TaxID=2993941 RepID=A0ABT3QSH0_9HYPH|nr:XRE family transcriptional regulator [Ochrobactrum chromiisoli]MCX2698560.1 XRE family transcriptional regulator [Ochrobactrum chromiisoli]